MTKRAIDLTVGAALLIATSPVSLACAGLVWLLDGRPILFRQTRVGLGGRHFEILKFRTMRPRGDTTTPDNQVTAGGDPRITPVGSFLRRFKLDELPQLLNVVRGDMSLVGPRPEVPRYVHKYRQTYVSIFGLRPGLTDFASLSLRDEEVILARHRDEADFYELVLLPRKLALARLYRRHRSTLVDLSLILATAFVVLGSDALGRRLVGADLASRARRGL